MGIQDVVKHFYGKFNLPCDRKTAIITVNQIKTLNKRGYTNEQIVETIDYIIKHPPKRGVFSFGYICTTIDEIQSLLKELENQTILKVDKSKIKTKGNKAKMTQAKIMFDTSLFK